VRLAVLPAVDCGFQSYYSRLRSPWVLLMVDCSLLQSNAVACARLQFSVIPVGNNQFSFQIPKLQDYLGQSAGSRASTVVMPGTLSATVNEHMTLGYPTGTSHTNISSLASSSSSRLRLNFNILKTPSWQ